jgi:DNA-binding transcriptional LysR family regulator
MQIETLKIFCDILETRSFSKAASLNYISQSAVSQQVRGLEERYRRKLIERGKRTLSPTQAGEVLYAGAKEILERFVTMENHLQVLSNSIAGSLRVATVYSVGLHELPPYLKTFMKRFPAANVRLEYSRSNRIYEDVSSGAVDLGIVAYPVRRSGLEVLRFREDTMVLIAAPSHPLARKRVIDFPDLVRQPFVAFEKDVPTRRAVDRNPSSEVEWELRTASDHRRGRQGLLRAARCRDARRAGRSSRHNVVVQKYFRGAIGTP